MVVSSGHAASSCRETGLTHLYTVEANYNTAPASNVVAPTTNDPAGRASPASGRRFPPKFSADVLQVRGGVACKLAGARGSWCVHVCSLSGRARTPARRCMQGPMAGQAMARCVLRA